MPGFGIGYVLGISTAGLLTWLFLEYREPTSGEIVSLAHESATQAAFIAATSDVCDEETCKEIKQRANDVLEELDIPGNPEWGYDDA